MNRRTFFARMATGIAAAALATHLTFGKLVPVLEPIVEAGQMDYYVIQWPVGNWWTAFSIDAKQPQVQFYAPGNIGLQPGDIVKIEAPIGSAEARHEIYDKLMKVPDDKTTGAAWRALKDPRETEQFQPIEEGQR